MNRSMEAILWAMKARGLSPTAWKLLLKLCDRVNNERDDFDVWPSQKRIADDCEVSVPTVKRHLQELVDGGFLRIIGQADPRSGAKTVNRYRIQVRNRSVMPKDYVSIDPEGPPKGWDQPDLGDSSPLNPPIAQSDLGGGFTGELTEPTKDRTYPIEPTPPLPSGEAPHGDDPSFQLDMPNSRSVPLVDYVAAEWKRLAADFPRIASLRAMSDSRRKKITARAREIAAEAPGMTLHDVWDQIFAAIRGSEFLRGDAEPGRGYSRPYVIEFDKLLEPKIFISTLERAPTDAEHNRVTSDPRTGRRFGPAEQAGREAFQRYLAGKKRG